MSKNTPLHQVNFYCDTGMKAVLRKICKMIKKQIKESTQTKISECSPTELRSCLISFFKTFIIGDSQESFEACSKKEDQDVTDQQIYDIMSLFLGLKQDPSAQSTI